MLMMSSYGKARRSWVSIQVDDQQLLLQQDVERLLLHREAQHRLPERQLEVDASELPRS